MITALAIVPSAICAAASVYMAVKGTSGWGWFLLAAVILASAPVQIAQVAA